MPKKSIEKKHKQEFHKNFSLFTYVSTFKALETLTFGRNLKNKNFQALHIPSSFNLLGLHHLQNPRIIIVYSKNLSFSQIKFLDTFKASCFKLNLLWYSHLLLKDCNYHVNTLNLCCFLSKTLVKKNLQLIYLISL